MEGVFGCRGCMRSCRGGRECTGRLERLASQVLRTDRSEFRKERHTGCRTECWWLPGLGSERHTGLRWALPESAQALPGAGAAAVYGSAVGVGTAAAYGSATGAGVPFGAYCAVAVGGMPGAGA